jgi:hypothetical protein
MIVVPTSTVVFRVAFNFKFNLKTIGEILNGEKMNGEKMIGEIMSGEKMIGEILN